MVPRHQAKYPKVTIQMKYFLVLFFTCGHGCGFPPEVTLPTRYETLQSCLVAGNAWISPKANPTRAVWDSDAKRDNDVIFGAATE